MDARTPLQALAPPLQRSIMRNALFAIAALTLLCAGALLEVGSIDIPGLNAVITLFFAAAVGVGLFSRRPWGHAGAALSLSALVVHVGLLILA